MSVQCAVSGRRHALAEHAPGTDRQAGFLKGFPNGRGRSLGGRIVSARW
jgi:hypothetical protein